MLTREGRQAYMQTLMYKMVFILSGYRKLIGDSGTQVVEDIQRIWAKEDKPHDCIDRSFMTFVDLGYIVLGEDEVRAYFDSMYDLYKYPESKREDAYKSLRLFAMLAKFDDDLDDITNEKRAILQIRAMSYLDSKLN